jgi:hypothetical protein
MRITREALFATAGFLAVAGLVLLALVSAYWGLSALIAAGVVALVGRGQPPRRGLPPPPPSN